MNITFKYIGAFILVSIVYLSFGKMSFAAYLKFDKTTTSAQSNQTFTADVIVDAGTDQITSSDIWITYDPAYLNAQTVTSGAFFPAVTNNITSGKVSITGLIVDPGTYKTGSGTVATITFKAIQNGSTNIAFDCRSDVSNSSKIIKNDVNATNIIECTKNVGMAVAIGTTASSSVSSTASVTTNVVPTTTTQLPESGIIVNISRFAVPGLLLLMIGGMLRFIR